METHHLSNEESQEHRAGKEGEPHFIVVNNHRFTATEGVKPEMTVEEIAKLAKIPTDVAVVRRYHGQHFSQPMDGDIELITGDHFIVTRKKVDGGYDSSDRVGAELNRLAVGGSKIQRLATPENAVIYQDLPVLGDPKLGAVDVLVQIPPAYPAQMIDYVAIPTDSPLIGRVKGAPQDVFTLGGRQWRRISYHPHGNGGAGPWDPQKHGFDTYLGEILSWLGDLQ